MYTLLGLLGIIVTLGFTLTLIKTREVALKEEIKRNRFTFSIGITSMFISFSLVIAKQDIATISYITELFGIFMISWGLWPRREVK